MKVYVVTSGSYSDYHINAVFTDQKMANAYVEQFNRGDRYDPADIEEWDADQPFPCWSADMNRYLVTAPDDDPEGDPHWWAHEWSLDMERHDPDDPTEIPSRTVPGGNWRMLVIARDQNHAIKVGTERLARHRMELERDGAAS